LLVGALTGPAARWPHAAWAEPPEERAPLTTKTPAATPVALPASADDPGAEGDREAGPDPAAAPAADPLDWGLAGSPERREVDVGALPDTPLPRLDPGFPVPGQFRVRVNFWRYIFAGVGLYDIVVHDTRHMDKVYEVVAMSPRPAEWKTYLKVRKAAVRRAQEKYQAILERLATATPETRLTAEEQRVRDLLADLPGGPEKYREARLRIHGQSGMRDRFVQAVEVSEAYLPEMERVFRERNLPIELTRLPFVESGFNPKASSKARAVGVWQFIRSTARQYDLVDKKQDRRRDVRASTIAAAKLLSYNYRQTGSWPLALMAYHHGLGGIKRAVRATGTSDVDVIVRTYNGPRFKYASRNYYAQFVAVNELYNQIQAGRGHGAGIEEALTEAPRPAPFRPGEATTGVGPQTGER
jgi:membrane-bound lytic murein transglycosylase D